VILDLRLNLDRKPKITTEGYSVRRLVSQPLKLSAATPRTTRPPAMPANRPALIAPVLARPEALLAGVALIGACADAAAGAAGVVNEAGALGVSLDVPPQLFSQGGGGVLLQLFSQGGGGVLLQLFSQGGGGGVLVLLEDVQPVCAGFVRPMPWLRSHS
jgi:hypothetical protein